MNIETYKNSENRINMVNKHENLIIHMELTRSDYCGTTTWAAFQQSGGVGVTVAATSSTLVGFVWESVWKSSAALPSWDWGSGSASVSGGLSDWGGGGKWGSGGWHQTVGNDTSAGEVSVETERNRQGVVQVVESHVVEDVSEEVGIDFTVISGAGAFISIGVDSVWVGGGAQSVVVMTWVKWKVQVSENIFVLHGNITSGSSVFVINPNTIFGIIPSLAKTINVIHRGTSSRFFVAKVAPATVFENVGKCEKIHDVSVIATGSEGSSGSLLASRFRHGVGPDGGEIVSHGYGAHRADG